MGILIILINLFLIDPLSLLNLLHQLNLYLQDQFQLNLYPLHQPNLPNRLSLHQHNLIDQLHLHNQLSQHQPNQHNQLNQLNQLNQQNSDSKI